jgi:uncharacterized oxidoreductase
MNTSGNTVLITGGATGIGLALAEELVSAGNKVIICGRTEDKLNRACKKLPQISTRKCDLSIDKERSSLFDYVRSSYGDLNILINNAGIQRMVSLTKGIAALLDDEDEIEINLRAPIHLSALFIPLLSKQKQATIINVSSGLAFIPLAFAPVYCATKAALHSFSISLRHQLRDTPVRVFELISPMVDTDLDKGRREGRGQENRGIPASDVAKASLAALGKDEYEIAVGAARELVMGSRKNPEQLFKSMNSWQ